MARTTHISFAMLANREIKIAMGAVVALVGVTAAVVLIRRSQVVTVKAARGSAVEAVFATGTVEPVSRVAIRARGNGTVQDCAFREGDIVKKGDVLAHIEDPRARFALDGSKAEYDAAKVSASDSSPQLANLRALGSSLRSDLATARGELSRVSSLVKSGALPALELDRAKARVSQLNGQVAANDQQQRAAKLELKTNLARAEKSMSSLSAQVQDSDILSPLDGVIVRRNIEPGQVVGPGEPLIEIADISHLVVQLAVDENDVSRVNGEDSGGEGSAVAVRFPAFKERFFTGRVERVSPDADRARGGFFVRVRLDEPPAGLRSGMRAEANIVVAEAPGAVLVPADSVAENSVWVVKSGRVERRDVKVGMRDVSSVEIVSGLNEGEDVVLTPPQDLSPGGLVAVKSIDYFGGGQRKGDTANAVAGLHNPAGRPGQGLPTARPKPATRVARAGELPND